MSTGVASSSFTVDWGKYDVFLSFSGADTRHGFTGNLYARLKDAGFYPFLDDDGIERGEDIKSELEKAIQESSISIVVLSKNYPSSGWCLDELVMILQRRRKGKLLVIPVFYEVDPSDFRKQTGSVGNAFRRHQERFKGDPDNKIQRWRAALTEVANLAGKPYTSKADGYEYQCIDKIVKEVQNKLRRTFYTESNYVGINSHILEISNWLSNKSSDVGVLVIRGIGGIGKTTIARQVYDMNRHRFSGSSFLSSVRDFYVKPNDFGLLRLQKNLLLDIQGSNKMEKARNIHDGWSNIKRALRFKGPFLLVLDDVDQLSQLDEILRMKDWFSKGSKIIITTRLREFSNQVCNIYEVQSLSFEESLELFSRYAFGQNYPKESYEDQAKLFLAYCDGVPLALKVLGSSLSHKSLAYWECQLKNLKEFPKDITQTLKVSFDSLEDDNDRNIFLDIACFFVAKDKGLATAIIEGCNFPAITGIENLIDRGLLTIDQENKLVMHQLIQDMGKQIVRENAKKYPEKCRRLWNHIHSLDVLRSKTGTKYIEGLILDLKDSNTEALETDAFKNMHNLRIVQLNYARINGCYKAFPKKLKWLCWHGFPLESIPNNFPLEELVALDMRRSNLNMWHGTKLLGSLKFLNLSHSILLNSTPDFTLVPNLEKLVLKDCPNLIEIHESLSNLKKLLVLNIKDCKSLGKLPKNIGMVKSLKQLIISNCSSLVGIDEEVKMMCSLETFVCDGISIGQLLSSSEEIGLWSSSQKRMGELSWRSLPSSLVTVSLVGCNLWDNDFPKEFSNLTMLKHLQLGNNPFHDLPDCVKSLTNLKTLDLSFCEELTVLEWTLCELEYLDVSRCRALQKITYRTTAKTACGVYSYECDVLCKVQDKFLKKSVKDMDAEALKIMGFSLFDLDSVANTDVRPLRGKWKRLPQVQYMSGVFSTSFPGGEIPDCFCYTSMNPVMRFIVPSQSPNVRVRGMNVCIIYTIPPNNSNCTDDLHIEICLINKSKNLRIDNVFDNFCVVKPNEPMVWISYWLSGVLFDGGDYVEVFFHMFEGNGQIKEYGINFLYIDEEEDKKEIQNIKCMVYSRLSEDFVDANNFGCVVPKGFFEGYFRVHMECRPWRMVEWFPDKQSDEVPFSQPTEKDTKVETTGEHTLAPDVFQRSSGGESTFNPEFASAQDLAANSAGDTAPSTLGSSYLASILSTNEFHEFISTFLERRSMEQSPVSDLSRSHASGVRSRIPWNEDELGNEPISWRGWHTNRRSVLVLEQLLSRYPGCLDKFRMTSKSCQVHFLSELAELVYHLARVPFGEWEASDISRCADILADLKEVHVDVSWVEDRVVHLTQLRHFFNYAEEISNLDRQIESRKEAIGRLMAEVRSHEQDVASCQARMDGLYQQMTSEAHLYQGPRPIRENPLFSDLL